MPAFALLSSEPSPDMPIVGTAGHVDHGKSSIVRALTGTDPDRWAEEKERGLTIDLGFAWADLGGFDVGFVDVPGHERFIKNMLAGVGAVDCTLFVVAADSGWMPQSEEHASVIDLLGVEQGIIALSRIDLVDGETAELATLEILEETEGTALDGWPVVPVSAMTGEGMDDLRNEIVASLESLRAQGGNDPFRLWVDRAFTVAGAGQVATGTVLSGSATVDDELTLLPAGSAVRVRSLQHHGRAVDRVERGDRAAVNLAGGGVEAARGMLLTEPDAGTTSTRFLASVRPSRTFDSIPDRGAFHVHLGTASFPATLRRIAGTDGFIIALDEPAPVAIGDRLIVRDTGRRAVVGGGRILDTDPPPRPTPEHITSLSAVVDATADDKAQALLDLRRTATRSGLSAPTLGGRPAAAVGQGDQIASESFADDLTSALIDEAASFHADHPTRPGMTKGEVVSRHGVDPSILDAIVKRSNDIAETAGAIHLTSFVTTLTADEERQWTTVRSEVEASYDVPRLKSLDLPVEVVHFLLRRGDLVRIAGDLAFTDTQAQRIIDGVADLDDGFTVSEFKEHFGMARRQAVPTVEWLDSIGRTRRSGDGRSVRNR